MPHVSISKAKRGGTKYKSFKRQLYHDTLYDVLRPIRHAQKCGGFFAMHKGR